VFKDWVAAFVDDLDASASGWDDITEMIHDAYTMVAPKKLIALMRGGGYSLMMASTSISIFQSGCTNRATSTIVSAARVSPRNALRASTAIA
jgi:acetoin utilization deacetylase AcuC-like enzyme